jgi:biotin operon repressor
MPAKFGLLSTTPYEDKDLPHFLFRVYFGFCLHAGRDGRCHPSAKKIAGTLGTTLRYVHKAISELCERGYLIRESRGNYFLPHYPQRGKPEPVNIIEENDGFHDLQVPKRYELPVPKIEPTVPNRSESPVPKLYEPQVPNRHEPPVPKFTPESELAGHDFIEVDGRSVSDAENWQCDDWNGTPSSIESEPPVLSSPYNINTPRTYKKETPIPPYEADEHTSYDDPSEDYESPESAQPPYEQMTEESHPELYADPDPEPPVPATLFQKPSLEQRKATFQTQILDKYVARGKPLPDFILKLQAELEAETAALQQAPDYRTARQIAIDRELQEMNDLAAAKEAARIARREAITQRINRDVALEAEKARLEAEAALKDSAGEISPGFAGNPPPNAKGEIFTHFSGNPPPPTVQKSLTVAEPLLLAPTEPPKPKVPKSLDEIELPAWIPGDLWGRWLDHRKDIKAKFTPRAAAQMLEGLAKAREFGHDPQALMETAIVNSWRGCVFEKHLKPVQEIHSRAGQRFQPLADKDYRAKLEEGYQFLRDMRGGIPILGDPTFDAYQAQQQSQRQGAVA